MTEFLVSRFVKDAQDVHDPKVRERYGVFSSLVGVGCNLVLFVAKFLLGTLANSLAIVADGFNNLSDVGSSVVTLLGFKLAARPADRDHPYGHGRIEYLCGLVIAGLVLVVGAEFVRGSIEKILKPEPLIFEWVVVAGLLLSIGVKFWMNRFNVTLSKRINSASLAATAADSLSDVCATSVTLLALVLSPFTTLPVDGIMGLVVAGFILFAGYSVARDTITPLLGQAPDPELVREIRRSLMAREGIIGVHDLMVHDYGPGRMFASVHAEVPVSVDILTSHEVVDLAEREIGAELGLHLTIHMDPIDNETEATGQLRRAVVGLVHTISPDFSIHDFRVVSGVHLTNLIFDVLVPMECPMTEGEIQEKIQAAAKALDAKYTTVVSVDRDYAG